MLALMAHSPFLVPLLAAVIGRLCAIFIWRAAGILQVKLWWLGNLFALLQSVFLLLSFYWALVLMPAHHPGISMTGLLGRILIMAGALLLMTGLFELNLQSLFVLPHSALVTSGIYACIRRPSDFGVLIIGLGTALSQGTTSMWTWFLLWVPCSLLLSACEEWELAARHPQARGYFQKTPRYVPGGLKRRG